MEGKRLPPVSLAVNTSVGEAQTLGCIQRAFPTLVFFNSTDSWHLFSLMPREKFRQVS